jgi:hypothetical protein
MTTQVQEAQDLYNRLKPEAVRAARAFVMARTARHLQDEMAAIIDADIPPVDAPTVIDAPFISQAGAGAGSTLSCTLGNWNGAPTARVYQWVVAGVVVGTNSPNYTVVAGDVGKTVVCNMVATNGVGASGAVQSNTIAIA